MRLSDAIAMGRTLVTPVTGIIDNLGGGGCALGMAGRATGGFAANECGVQMEEVHKRWPWTASFLREDAPCKCYFWQKTFELPAGIFSQAIAHLFDAHVMQDPQHQEASCENETWTLDQLIDWVRSVEPAELTEEPQQLVESASPSLEVRKESRIEALLLTRRD